ncbi:MAG TPA: hypothetical protein ENK44_08395 [Caldithrix abyssi]|uniref:Uncharacterized protein n=1 Tax=Caldithrix abyssi TaxID=187145 RepID=A0A7V4U0D2_CALAY|nr:hypothetical protein [Caldithrix abyssi]
MSKKILKNKQLTIVTLFIALAGGFLFFPVQMKDGYTCLFHRLFNSDDPVKVGENHHHTTSEGTPAHEDSEMLSFYLHRYAFVWWVSVALAVAAGYSIWRIKNKITLIQTKEHGGTH